MDAIVISENETFYNCQDFSKLKLNSVHNYYTSEVSMITAAHILGCVPDALRKVNRAQYTRYRFSDLSLIDHVETSPNPKGVTSCSVAGCNPCSWLHYVAIFLQFRKQRLTIRIMVCEFCESSFKSTFVN